VDFEDTYGFVFMKIMNRSIRPGEASYRINNRAMPGFSTFDVLKAVRKMNNIKLGDLVLVSLGSNDHAPATVTDQQRSENLQFGLEKVRKELEQFLFFQLFKSLWLSARFSFFGKN
jgi:hypothetical protein